MVSWWSLCNNKSPKVSRTLLGILADIVVLMVFTHPLISKSCINPLLTAPSAPITIGITITFHSFFQLSSKVLVLISFFVSFSLPLFSRFYFCWIFVGLVEILWSVRISKSHWSLCVLFSRTYSGSYIYCLPVKFKLLALFSVDHFHYPVVFSLILALD